MCCPVTNAASRGTPLFSRGWPLSLVCVCLLLFDSWHRECWGGRQGERCLE